MKKWVCVLLTGALLMCMTACKDTSDLSQDSTTTATTPSSSPSDYLTAVLEDEQTFVYNGEEMTLSHVLANYEDAIGRYALVDMDSDKQPEIAVEFDSQNFILVLHKDSDAYYGYLFTFRSMYQLNSDGSFYWNSGAGNHGCSRLVFKGNEYEKVELWRAEHSEDGSEAYYVEGNKVSKEDFESVAEEKKEPVAWVTWADTPTDDTTTATPTTTTCFTTATSTAPTNKTTETTVPKITATTNAYTAADLFFPIHNAALKAPETATMQEVSIAFDAAQKRVRMQLPQNMTLQLVERGTKTYAAIYCGKVRVGRLVPNFIFTDTVPSEAVDEMDIDGLTVQTFRYTAGADDSVTYSSYTMTGESFFYLLEISTDYVSATDLVKCLQSLESIQLLDRNNRLDSRNKEKLRIAIAGNSFIGYSDVVQQLQRILNNNGKDATVHEYWYPNITITDFAHDAGKLDMLCGGNYDILFINGAYTTVDANKLSVLEDACSASGTELVLFPAHNESGHNPMLAYRNTNVKMAFWRDAIYKLLEEGVPEAELIYYDGVLHSKPLAGYCGAVMIYGMLYETAPNTAAIGASYCGVSKELAQQVEEITMEFIRPYFE